MTEYSRGDVVLVSFIFTDETGVKQRPAVIISSDVYRQQRQEVIISAITSKIDRILEDYLNRSLASILGLRQPAIRLQNILKQTV